MGTHVQWVGIPIISHYNNVKLMKICSETIHHIDIILLLIL